MPNNPGKWMQRSQANLYVSGMARKYWAVFDLARLSEREYEVMVEQLVSVARGVSDGQIVGCDLMVFCSM